MSLLVLAAAGLAMVLVAAARAAQTSAQAESRGSFEAETVVRIYPTAVVTSATVTLNDIAALSGDDARLAGSWAITAAPAAGQELTIDAGAIQQLLVRRGINASNWVFRGSTKCRVSRPMPARVAEPASTPDGPAADRTARRAWRTNRNVPTSAPADMAGMARPQPSGPDPNTLVGVIHEHIAARIASLGGRPVIRVSPGLRDLMRLSRPTYEFRILDRNERLLGLVPLEVTVYRDGKVEQVQSILIEVALAKSVVVANGPINQRQTIRAEDVVLREQTFDRPERVGISDLKAVVGQRAVRLISKDEMLVTKDIEPVPFIVRNDLVTVTARRGNVSIKGTAKAMETKSYGETVELRNEISKQTFSAVVTGLKTAELVLSPSSAAPANAVSLAGGRD